MAWPAPRSPAGRLAAEARLPEGGGLVGHVEAADIGAGRDDLVDPVEYLVGERDVHTGEQVVELLHRARPDDRAGDARVGDCERHREVRHRQARLLGERDDLLDGVESALVAHVPENGGAAQVGPLTLADAPGEHPLRERAPHHDAHPVALGHGQHLGLDAAVQDRVGRLLGAEPLQSAPFGDPLGLDDVGGRHGGRPDRADLAGVDQVRQRRQCLLDVGVGVRPVDLVQVDVVGLQAAQRVLNRGHDPPPGVASPVGIVSRVRRRDQRPRTHLGGQDDAVLGAP